MQFGNLRNLEIVLGNLEIPKMHAKSQDCATNLEIACNLGIYAILRNIRYLEIVNLRQFGSPENACHSRNGVTNLEIADCIRCVRSLEIVRTYERGACELGRKGKQGIKPEILFLFA